MKSDRRRITREDVLLKARMISEGVRVKIEKVPPGLRHPDLTENPSGEEREAKQVDVSKADDIVSSIKGERGNSYQECLIGNVIILDRAGIMAPIIRKAGSPLLLTLDGEKARITEDGQALAGGSFYSPSAGHPWSSRRLKNGVTLDDFLFGTSPGIVNVLFNLSCYNHNSGQACRYCGLFGNQACEEVDELPLGALKEYADITAEAVKIMTDLGWRGVVALGGGALPPSLRNEYLDRVEIVMEPLHDVLDAKTLGELHLVYNHYPPEDFSDFHRMRKMGIQSTSIDMEMVTPKGFKAICPGKHAYKPLEYWKEAQEAALEASLISATNIVVGIEPKEAVLEGVHERLSKGVFPVPLQFLPTPNAAMARTPAKSAEWIVDVAERIADAYIRSFVNVTRPLGKSAMMSFVRKITPKAVHRVLPQGWDVPGSAAMPMTVNCVAFDEMVRRVHRIPGGRLIPLPTASS
jgi:hypothetical protein